MRVYHSRLSATTNLDKLSEVQGPWGVIEVQYDHSLSGVVKARYNFSKRVILLGELTRLPRALALGCLAHELGHAHHQWHWETRYTKPSWERVWQGLVDQGLVDGYAAKNCREGWAEVYRLNLGCAFDPKEGGTVGDWQYSPQKVKAALQAWRGIL